MDGYLNSYFIVGGNTNKGEEQRLGTRTWTRSTTLFDKILMQIPRFWPDSQKTGQKRGICIS